MTFSIIQHEYIFSDERPFASCHASTIVVLPNEDIVVAWFGGTQEAANDVAIWLSCRRDGKWTVPVKIADKEKEPLWNPVLFRHQNGLITLYYKVGKKLREWQTFYITSRDEGHTWSSPALLVEGDRGGRGPVKNKLIRLQNGAIAAPASLEIDRWDAFVDLSYNDGVTWTASGLVPLPQLDEAVKDETVGVIQPTLWESKPGHVHMLLRSNANYIYRSDSEDSGKTWCEAYPNGLPNNNSGIDLTQMSNGDLVLAYNPVAGNWKPRVPLILSISHDNGNTWPKSITLEDVPAKSGYSYPAIVAEGNHLHVTYTWRRERIAYWEIVIS